ncbi:MAG: GspE/PulE family protein [Candidatus Saganbacteria bacterium]|nr:GspE/PulE family protein [Candidatus Saganbacteria bacterium]
MEEKLSRGPYVDISKQLKDSRTKKGFGIWDPDYDDLPVYRVDKALIAKRIEASLWASENEINNIIAKFNSGDISEEKYLFQISPWINCKFVPDLIGYYSHLPKIEKEKSESLVTLINYYLGNNDVVFAPILNFQKEGKIFIAINRDPSHFQNFDQLTYGLKEIFDAKEVKYVLSTTNEVRKAAKIFLKTRIHHEEVAYNQKKAVGGKTPVEFIENLMHLAINLRASDIHIAPVDNDGKYSIKFRIDGDLRDIDFLPPEKYKYENIIARIKILTEMDTAEHRKSQDGGFTTEHFGRNIDLRVVVNRVANGEKVTIRLLDRSQLVTTKDKLGISQKDIVIINRLLERKQGFIIIAGPTGSGKTTTLYTLLNSIKDIKGNIVTIEDPIEYKISGLNQMPVQGKLMGFAELLKSVVRGDPDVILVGEIRDKETAEAAAAASMTGHLVFSTVHANSSSEVFKRLLSLKLNQDLISSEILAVISQRLVPKICDHCKIAYVPTDEELASLNIKREELENGVLYMGKGCPKCGGTGYFGREGVFEILLVNDAIKELIDLGEGMNAIKLRKKAVESGMRKFVDNVKEKVLLGITTIEKAKEIALISTGMNY